MNVKSIAIAITIATATVTGAATAQQVKRSAQPGYIGIRYDYRVFDEGVKVGEVSKNSPAEKAGIKPGDEILRINGLSAANGKFQMIARNLTEGDTVRLRISRA